MHSTFHFVVSLNACTYEHNACLEAWKLSIDDLSVEVSIPWYRSQH